MSVDTAAQSVSLDWLLDSMQERKWARSSSTWSLRDSHISTRAVSLFSSIVSFPNGSLGRSFAQVGAAKPTTIATTVTNAAICIFRTPRQHTPSPHRHVGSLEDPVSRRPILFEGTNDAKRGSRKRPDRRELEPQAGLSCDCPWPTVLSASCCNNIVEHLEAAIRHICE